MEGLRQLRAGLFAPVDISSLVFFRVCFGLTMLWEVWRFFSRDWIGRHYLAPEFLFPYQGFAWVAPWPETGLYWHFAVLGVTALMITVGALYRVATVVFLFGFAYVFLLDQARHLNHFYLVILLAFLLCLVPAHRAFSVDAWLWPRLRSRWIPAWPIWLLRGQLEIVLIFAGLVKVNADWLRLRPLAMWFAEDADLFLVGPLLTEPWVVEIGAYGAILLHLVGAPLLLFARTRVYVFALYVGFHLANHVLFNIGIFPWLTIFATTLFFAPDWPRRLARRAALATAAFWNPGGAVQPGPPAAPGDDGRPLAVGPLRANLTLLLVALWLLLQVLIPTRHLLYPGDVTWTEEGHRFSWRMKLRDKEGRAMFEVRDPATGHTWCVYPRRHLTAKQSRKMPGRPAMLLQFAAYLAEVWEHEHGIPGVQVRADVLVSLNGRPPARLVDPRRDLVGLHWGWAPSDWLLPPPMLRNAAADGQIAGTSCMRLLRGSGAVPDSRQITRPRPGLPGRAYELKFAQGGGARAAGN